jgi:4-hydroxybutyrate dehydrogenase
VEKGAAIFETNNCDSIVALGGGSPMDAAKVIKVAATHPAPLAQYDDALGGDRLIVNPMPPLYAIATTSGTGSEVGRSGVIVMRKTQKKTIFFAPALMPDIAVLVPRLTSGLPAHITVATGIDAFTHSLEAWLAPGFHPLADGLALEGMRLCIDNLETCYSDGQNLEARGRMQLAATMGATAFQKGLGMIHSLAHPLSAQHSTHHGLANALLLPASIEFIENSDLNDEQSARLETVIALFHQAGLAKDSLSATCRSWFTTLGIKFGLNNHNIPEDNLQYLSEQAFEDPCHSCNIIPVTKEDLLGVYRKAY